MSFNEYIIQQALVTARAEKATMRRMSRRASQRRAGRAVSRRNGRKDYMAEEC